MSFLRKHHGLGEFQISTYPTAGGPYHALTWENPMTLSPFVLKASAVVVLGLLAMATTPSRAVTRADTFCANSCAVLDQMICGLGSTCEITGCIGASGQWYSRKIVCELIT